MARQEVDEYFSEIGAWMKNDIKREIDLARVSQTQDGRDALSALGVPPGGGNLLAALGLVAYTEALGLLRVWNTTNQRYGSPPECFHAFFDEMAGGGYKSWWDTWAGNGGKPIYDVLRNGLVHEYRPKVDSGFWIGSADELGLGESDGVLIFKVAPYYRDFLLRWMRCTRNWRRCRTPRFRLRAERGGLAVPDRTSAPQVGQSGPRWRNCLS